MRILVVEDDPLIARGIADGLRTHGLSADSVNSLQQARLSLEQVHCDAIVLDRGLPDGDGLSLLQQLRACDNPLPILLLTARDAIADRIDGLQQGADDYLVKPFDLGELVARLHALARRSQGRASNLLQQGRLCLDPSSGECWLDGQPVPLSRREFLLLSALLQARGRILTTDQLKDRIYGLDQDVGSNVLNVHLHHLRRKLGEDVVLTVRGLGYRYGWSAQ